jgi:uncharacterized protein with FMN-binding domain
MRKYLQIIFVLGAFGTLVLLRQFKGSDTPVVGAQNINSQVSPTSSSSTAAATPTPTSASGSGVGSGSMMPTSMPMMGQYKNGTYTGSVQDAFYGNIQVQATVTNGKISNVTFLQFPNDNRTSQYVNSVADPMLAQEAIQAQSANVNIISGASASSQAFQASLADALSQAK